MNRLIAPGNWTPESRKKAKWLSAPVGMVFVAGGFWLGNVLILKSFESNQAINFWAVVIPLVPIAIGASVLFPNIITPIIYRLIEKFGQDTVIKQDTEENND